VSLRVTPRPRAERSLSFAEKWPESHARLIGLMGRPLPLSGAFHDGERLYIRLSGTERGVAHAAAAIGGDETPLDIWRELRHHRLPIFHSHRVWRLSTPRTSEVAPVEGQMLIDWAGAQRWLATRAPARSIRQAARDAGGYATLFQGVVDGEDVFEQMPPPLFRLHQRLKRALDPSGVFNRSRVYDGF
jgi:glycolate oxidase FAD binding subunit